MRKKTRRKAAVIAAAALAASALSGAYVFCAPLLRGSGKDCVAYVYVRSGDTFNEVLSQLDTLVAWPQRAGLMILSKAAGGNGNVHTGRYAVNADDNAISFFRALKGGLQEPVSITIPQVRTMNALAGYLSARLMIDSAEFVRFVSDSAKMAAYGVDTANAYCLFVPDTYQVYWDVAVKDFLKRMKREADGFWTDERLQKAAAIPLKPAEVCTLASIVDEETADKGEKNDIAGMYINRLRKGIPLQADPTIKFAHRDFALRRIYHKLLKIDSPYNTYRNIGLPPGPIRIASVEAIEAVLNYTRHSYLYMCAKEDFSGTHRFARTYAEHLANAKRYSKALDKRGIK